MSQPFLIEVGLASSTHYLPWLRRWVAAMGAVAGRTPLSPAAVWRCTAALIEAVNNAIVHAHRRDARRRVWLRCRIDGRRVTLTVRDTGRAFTPRRNAMPSPVCTTGRGLSLMRTLMDRVQYRRRNDGNEMTLVYYRGSRRPPDWQSQSGPPLNAARAAEGRGGRALRRG